MDIKGANILLGFDKSATGQAYLVDFGLACHYTTKDFKADPKKMHNGTIEYTSRDAHLGIPTMRGDFEVLAYNLLHWSGGSLPWELKKLLPNPKAVQESKEAFMKSIDNSVKTSFGATPPPPSIGQFFKYVLDLKYEQSPDYDKCRKLFADALKSIGKTNAGDLDFKLQPIANNKSSTKAAAAAKPKTVRTKSPTAAKQTKRAVPIPISDTESDEDVVGPSHGRVKTPIQRPRKRAVPVQKSDAEDTDDDVAGPSHRRDKTPPIQRPRKRAVVEDDASPPSMPTPKKTKPRQPAAAAAPSNSTKTIINTQPSSTPGTLTVNSHSSSDGKKSGKTYEINFELNVSIDANVVLNVRRKEPKGDRLKGKKVDALPSNLSQLANGANDEDEVIPSSTENTPVARVRVSKKANVATPARRSPRGQ